MGCCNEGVASRRAALCIPAHSPETKPSHCLEAEYNLPFDNQALARLNELQKRKSYRKIAEYITSTEQVTESSDTRIRPCTIGAFALVFLKQGLASDPHEIEALCQLHIDDLLQNLSKDPVDLQIYSLVLVNLVLEGHSDHLRQHLAHMQCFPAILQAMCSPHRCVQRLATELASRIYSGDFIAQRQFLKAGGHLTLVALIGDAISDDDSLCTLLDCMFDLLVVRLRQDSNNCLIPEHLTEVKKTVLFDVLKSMNQAEVLTSQRSFDLIVRFDTLKQLWRSS